MDANGDGKLSKAELDHIFEVLDANRDGVISFEEWHGYLVRSGLGKAQCENLEALFRQLDKDQDGAIR